MSKLHWQISVPIFKNRVILKSIGLAVGIPFAIVIGVILLSAGADAGYALLLIGLLFILTFLLLMILYGGRYAPGFIIDDTGITNYTQSKYARRSDKVNKIAVLLGALSANPTVAGAGLIAQSKQTVRIRWKNIKKAKYDPKRYTIMISGGFTEKMAVFCTQENYEQVLVIIKEKTSHIKSE